MNYKEIAEQLTAVLQALNNTSVRGKQNLTNLIGSIQVLESVIAQLEAVEARSVEKRA